MTQCEKIVNIMLKQKDRIWSAKDFQSGDNFIGYEASARMSDLIRMFPNAFITGKEGRFRTLKINLDNVKELEDYVNDELELKSN